eukprot:symbB.v1.2.009650.t1/scaffold593.1/size185935/1
MDTGDASRQPGARRGTVPNERRGREATVTGIAQRSRSVFEPRSSDRYHQPNTPTYGHAYVCWVAMGEADPRRATKNADSKYIAALSDVRLEGSNEAVYFVLRGLGMKAFQGVGA